MVIIDFCAQRGETSSHPKQLTPASTRVAALFVFELIQAFHPSKVIVHDPAVLIAGETASQIFNEIASLTSGLRIPGIESGTQYGKITLL